jgi:hypothetical protein
MTERCKSCDHDTQAHAPDGSGCLFEIKSVGIGDDRICLCNFNAWKPVPCRVQEGATGIECSLARDHHGPHEGIHTPRNDETESVGYGLLVRWPVKTEA